MIRKIIVLCTIVVLSASLMLAQTGKLRGKVTDKETGEPLIGATIVLEGTSLGAASDINGDYFVLSVPAGTFSMKASYVGYASYTISNVRINSNITTTQDFLLTSEAIQVKAVEIIAERPLIQRNTTNTIRLTTQESIENLPIRGLQNILALEAGVVMQDGDLYVRGGRSGEVAFYLDGASTTNPISNTQSVGVIQEAIEEVQLQAGGYTAEFGGSNSAITRTTLRAGQSQMKATFDILTDNFAKPGSAYFGSSSFGYRNIVATVSGPIIPNLKFFLAGQENYVRNRDFRYVTPFEFDSLVTDIHDSRGAGVPLPGPVRFRENYIPNNWRDAYTVQGTLVYDFHPYKLRFTGSYESSKLPIDGSWPTALQGYFNQKRNRLDETMTGFGNLRFTHIASTTTFYEIGLSYQNRYFHRYDPDFKDDWTKYTDSAANAAKGYTGFRGYYEGPSAYSTIRGFTFENENAPNNSYSKNSQISTGITADITSQVLKNWEMKAGGRLDFWKTRNLTVGDISSAMIFLYGKDGHTPRYPAVMNDSLEMDRRIRVAKNENGTINHYGYDVDGEKVDDGVDAARKPLFASAYFQNKLEYSDLILNFGLRYEYMNTKNKTFNDPSNPDFNADLDIIDETKLKDVAPFELVLPRISFSFPVTDNTVFYTMYGKYAQMPSLNQIYAGNTILSRTVSPLTRGNAFLTPVGFLMKPERTTQYEMGFRQTLSENFAFTISGFYKDIRDQLQVRSYLSSTGSKLYTALLNEDFGTVKGLELTLELRRVNRFTARLNYTLSDAKGTGSNSRSSFGAIEQNIGRPVNYINPLDFDQRHRGSVLLDYRFDKGDGGPVLEGLGANLLLSFNSGHAYTRIKEPKELGQASAWNVGVRPLIDPRSSFPVEPLNSSSTPWIFNIDFRLSKMVSITDINAEFYVDILNLLNTKNVINVYPSTGTPQDDGWLTSPLATSYVADPVYAGFYKAINLDNQWAYTTATGNELYGTPRQVRFGVKIEL